ncbi:MAG: TraB/GumN family protein [Desulfobacterales bacterium]
MKIIRWKETIMAIYSRVKQNRRRAYLLFILCLIIINTFSADIYAQQSKPTTSPKHCLWLVKTPQNKNVYLLGSLHVLKSEAYPLAKTITEAYRQSQKVVFETDMAALADPATQSNMMMMGLYPEGQTLFQNISSEMQRELKKKMTNLEMKLEHFARFKPWLMAVSLTLMELQRLGFSLEYGIDVHFYGKATIDNKEIGFLEPVDFQLELLGKMNLQDQNAFLGQTLKDLDIAARMADDMLTYWKKGDADNLYALLFKSFEGYPQIENRLISQRNLQWVKKIEEMMVEDKNIIVIVGAGHLIGPGSVVALLKQKGYRVKQK